MRYSRPSDGHFRFASMPNVRSPIVVALLLVACQEPSLKGVENNEEPEHSDEQPIWHYNRDVDLLFVIDDSATMGDVQARLADAMGTLVAELDALEIRPDLRVGFASVRPGDRSCDSTPGGLLPISSCRERPEQFVARDGTDSYDTSCAQVCPLDSLAVEPTMSSRDDDLKARRWIEFGPRGTNLGIGVDPAQALGCALPQGTDGCGYPAMLQSFDDAFTDGLSDDFGGAGFFREAAGFVGVMVTNRVDCSVTGGGQTIFDPDGSRALWSDPTADAPTPAVCWNAGVECTPGAGPDYDDCEPAHKDAAGELVEPGLGVMTDIADHDLRFSYFGWVARDVITLGGFPEEGAQRVYAHADDPVFQGEYGIGPGCKGPGGSAPPSVRLGAFMGAVGGATLSVCADDLHPAARRIAEAIARQTRAGCVPVCVVDTEPETEGLQVSCRVTRAYPTEDNIVDDVLARCEGDSQSPRPPEGEEICWFPRTDDDLATECREREMNLEIELAWNGPLRPPVGFLSADCNTSKHPSIDCPEL